MSHWEFERRLQNSNFKPTKQTPSDILENINFCVEKQPGRRMDDWRSENASRNSNSKLNILLDKLHATQNVHDDYILTLWHSRPMAVDASTMKMIINDTRGHLSIRNITIVDISAVLMKKYDHLPTCPILRSPGRLSRHARPSCSCYEKKI